MSKDMAKKQSKNRTKLGICTFTFAFIMAGLTACSSVTMPKLRSKAQAPKFDSSDMSNEFSEFIGKANDFALPLIENINKGLESKTNSAYSPASLFYAIGMLSEVTSNEDKQNLLNILDVNKDELNRNIKTLYMACNSEFGNKKVIGKERIDNSIWLDDRYAFNEQILDDLANVFYADSFSCNFETNNEKSNQAISDYVKDCTDGFLEPNYNFDQFTSFVLLNTLYFEDVWNDRGIDLNKDQMRNFKNYDNSVSNLQFYKTYYAPGKIIETETYKSMFCKTYNGFKIDFIVPKDGVNVDDLFTEEVLRNHETLEQITSEGEGENRINYLSNILTPEFNASFDDDILENFYSTYKINDVDNFSDFATKKEGNSELTVKSIVHTTKVEFKKDKVKGAASTAIVNGNPGAPSSREVFNSLIVDRPFIYTIKDPQGINLFQGVVYEVK